MAQDLKHFAGQKFAGSVGAGIPDAHGLWVLIDNILLNADWTRVAPWGLSSGNPPAGVPVSPNDGVTIFVPAEEVSKLAPAANALWKALNRAGIKAYEAPTSSQTRSGVLVIEVGTKPQ